MGRPNLKETRTAEILDAFERCVGMYGLEGSSLERIAEQAGMKRSILRHYIGNREELVLALCERVVKKYRDELKEFSQSITSINRIDQLLNLLLPMRPRENSESIMVIESLIAASDLYPEIRTQMLEYVDEVVGTIAKQLKLEYPTRADKECWWVAYGVTCMWFNQESLTPLRLPRKYILAARDSTQRLIRTLDS